MDRARNRAASLPGRWNTGMGAGGFGISIGRCQDRRFDSISRMMHESTAHLNLWKHRLGRVPEPVWERTELETLVLADNDLTEVSEKIGSLRKLRMLDLGHNKLSQVPDALGDIVGLTDFLYLHDNQLVSLPASFACLTKLRYLNIGDNAFKELPE